MSIDWAIRYAPIVSFIRTHRPISVLEVGSGPQGIAYFLKDMPVVGTDVQFGEKPRKNIRPVMASCIDLPFRENAFEMVVSSDMMEHLPEKLRQSAMKEMLRIASRYVVVGFPSGAIARAHDLDVAAFLNRWGIKMPIWVSEHLEHEYPTSQSVLEGLPLDSMRCRVVRNANWRLHKMLVLLQTSYRFNRLVGFLRLDNVNLMMALGRVLDQGKTYRELIFLAGHDAVR
jgi:methyltransferase family protein